MRRNGKRRAQNTIDVPAKQKVTISHGNNNNSLPIKIYRTEDVNRIILKYELCSETVPTIRTKFPDQKPRQNQLKTRNSRNSSDVYSDFYLLDEPLDFEPEENEFVLQSTEKNDDLQTEFQNTNSNSSAEQSVEENSIPDSTSGNFSGDLSSFISEYEDSDEETPYVKISKYFKKKFKNDPNSFKTLIDSDSNSSDSDKFNSPIAVVPTAKQRVGKSPLASRLVIRENNKKNYVSSDGTSSKLEEEMEVEPHPNIIEKKSLFEGCKINANNSNIIISRQIINPVAYEEHFTTDLNIIPEVSTTVVKFNPLFFIKQKKRKWTQVCKVTDDCIPRICSRDDIFGSVDYSITNEPRIESTTQEMPPEDNFKMPETLSLKRPPTRTRKFTDKSGTSMTPPSLPNLIDLTSERDDVISIFGTPSVFDFGDNLDPFVEKEEPESAQSMDSSESNSPPYSPIINYSIPPPNIYISPPPIPATQPSGPIFPNSPPILTAPTTSPQMQVQNWLTDLQEPRVMDFQKVPRVFRKFCFNYFLKNRCMLGNSCNFSHTCPSSFRNILMDLLEDDLLHAYKYSVEYPTLFKTTYSLFCEAFCKNNMKTSLIYLLYDAFLIEGVNWVSAVNGAITNLERNGNSFKDSVDFIVIQIGLTKYPQLGDILLEIVSNHPRFEENWEIIRKLTMARTKFIDPRVVTKMINRAIISYPVNVPFCLNIQDHIICKKLVEIEKIPPDLMTAFAALCQVRENNGNLQVQKEVVPPNGFKERLANFLHRSSNFPSNEPQLNKAVNLEKDFAGSSSHGSNQTQKQQTQIPVLRRSTSSSTDKSRVSSTVNINSSARKQGPVYGRPNYDRHFSLNHSLHNLYPKVLDTIDLNGEDIISLDRIIKYEQGRGFLYLLEKYKNPCTFQHFICHCIAVWKNLRNIFSSYSGLISSIESINPNFLSENTTKAALEVITFNILFELEKRGLSKQATELLTIFNDWDSLVSSKVLTNVAYSQMGRYIYLLKLFIKTPHFYYAFEILRNPNLKLLECSDNWPFFFIGHDVKQRNQLVDKFLKTGYHYSIFVVNELYKVVLLNECSEYDVKVNINPMFTEALNGKTMPVLRQLYKDFYLYYPYLEKNIFRAFVITMYNDMEEKDYNLVYERGVEKDVYRRYDGTENRILMKASMFDCEIRITLKYFFEKIIKNKNPKHIIIDIGLPDRICFYPDILKDSVRSVFCIYSSIREVLAKDFGITIPAKSENLACINISCDQIFRLCKRQVS